MQRDDAGTILAMNAGRRVLFAAVLVALLWGGVIWAL